jgi:signal transduction histidine kinase
VNIVKPLANKKNINLIKDSKDFCEIDADYQKIQQILYNLLSNAIKFTQTEGSIHIGYTVDKKHLTLYVKDNGVGIDMKYKGKIFGKFVQLNNVYSKKESSTGLGLTITKELTELHKGKIWFESVVGKGTTFYVKLPLRHKGVKEIL